MPTIKQQAQQIASQLPAALRQPAMQAVAAAPDAPLPDIAPTLRTGNSATLNVPSLFPGMRGVSLTVPTPQDGVRAIEGVLPAGVPKLSGILANVGLGLPGLSSGSGNGGSSNSDDRPPTSSRDLGSASGRAAARTQAGGYRGI